MPLRKKIHIAERKIVAYFKSSPTHVFTIRDLQAVLATHRYEWDLARHTTTEQFIDFLIERTELRKVTLTSKVYPSFDRFVWGEVSPYLLALSLKKKAYLSHATAVFLHALTEQIPKIIYVNHEQSVKPKASGTLAQDSINRAFANRQRRSKYILRHNDFDISILSGKNTGNLGVVTLPSSAEGPLVVTGLERTLIDIVVRPDYAGGVFHVLKAYESAKSRMSVNVLMAHLKKLDYVYPYHQAIGFYMEKAGYEAERLKRLRALPMRFDFYLAHQIGEKDYDPGWRLFFPKRFQ